MDPKEEEKKQISEDDDDDDESEEIEQEVMDANLIKAAKENNN